MIIILLSCATNRSHQPFVIGNNWWFAIYHLSNPIITLVVGSEAIITTTPHLGICWASYKERIHASSKIYHFSDRASILVGFEDIGAIWHRQQWYGSHWSLIIHNHLMMCKCTYDQRQYCLYTLFIQLKKKAEI